MSRTTLNISTDDKFASSLKYIRTCLSQYEKSKLLRTKLVHSGGRHELLIAFETPASAAAAPKGKDEISVRKIASVLVNAIADIVVTDCKAYYITTRTKLPMQDALCKHAFIKALSEFDSNADKLIAKSLLRLTPTFLLDSYYEFMLDVLKKRWQEVINLANENVCYLVCDKTFAELLRFLISNIESRSDEVHLFNRAEKIEVLSGALKPFNNIYINEDLPADIQVVSKLISIAPKKIFLHQEKTPFEVALVKNIQNLFGGCVFITN